MEYITEEDFNIFLSFFKEKDLKYRNLCCALFYDGLNIKEAMNKVGYSQSKRAFEKFVKRKSQGNFCPADFKKAWKYNHPEICLNRKRNKIRTPIPLRIRWQVLSRDNFRCISCGMTSKEIILHVDHIIPISKGGNNDLNNLRTLCSMCNLGRGNIL